MCACSVLVLILTNQGTEVCNHLRQMMSVVARQPPRVTKTGQPLLHTLTNTLSHRCIPSQKSSVTGAHQAVLQITAVRQPTWSTQAWVVDCAASGSSLMACSSCATAELVMVAWKGATGHKEKSEPSEHTKSTWSIAQQGSECQHEAMPWMCSLNGRWHDKLYTV